MKKYFLIILVVALVFVCGCAAPEIKLFTDATTPLQEFILQGKEEGKVLVIPISGIISDDPKESFLRTMPSIVQEVVSQLQLAEKDNEVKAILLKIDSPGGSTTASDLLYHEIMDFKKRKNVKVIVSMMGVAASGGYYISLPADFIMAHPTTITGSIGVIFIRPMVANLMNKIGLDIVVNKSGENKDMGSPFRLATIQEQKILQNLTDELGQRFMSLVAKHRKLDKEALNKISTARVYLAEEALQIGLIDKIGYLSDAILQAKRLSGLSENAKVVAYRRTKYPNDNLYNTSTTQLNAGGLSLIDLRLLDSLTPLRTGFYYLWSPASKYRSR